MQNGKWFFPALLLACLIMATTSHGADTTTSSDTQTVDPIIAAANQEKAIADAKKAAYDAQSAKSKAELDAIKARIGDIPASGYTGKVELKENAGQMEASLLTSAAIVTASSEITRNLPCGKTKTIFLSVPNELPSTQALLGFMAQLGLLEQAKSRAEDASKVALVDGPLETIADLSQKSLPAAAIPAVGATLEAGSKLLSYFKTEFTVGGVQTSFDDTIVIHALAGRLASSTKYKAIIVPSMFEQSKLTSTMETILKSTIEDQEDSKSFHLKELAAVKKYTELVAAAEIEKKDAEDVPKKTKTSDRSLENAVKKLSVANKGLKAHIFAEGLWQKAIDSYDAFFTKMFTANDKGDLPIAQVVRADALNTIFQDGYILVTKLQVHGGSYYTKKNIWTTFGEMPFYNSGGATISYMLFDGASRTVLASGVVPVLGGFVKPSGIAEVLEAAKTAPETFQCK